MGEALKVVFSITGVALVGLVVFAIAAVGHFRLANLVDITPSDAVGASAFLPHGYLGVWSALPFAIWFFLAVEGVPLAAEETADPARNVPRGITAAFSVLVLTCAAAVLLLATGAGGAAAMSSSGNPLVAALGPTVAATVVNYIGLAGLVASFFSIIYAY